MAHLDALRIEGSASPDESVPDLAGEGIDAPLVRVGGNGVEVGEQREGRSVACPRSRPQIAARHGRPPGQGSRSPGPRFRRGEPPRHSGARGPFAARRIRGPVRWRPRGPPVPAATSGRARRCGRRARAPGPRSRSRRGSRREARPGRDRLRTQVRLRAPGGAPGAGAGPGGRRLRGFLRDRRPCHSRWGDLFAGEAAERIDSPAGEPGRGRPRAKGRLEVRPKGPATQFGRAESAAPKLSSG